MSDDELEKNDIELLRKKNLEERNSFLSTLMDDPEFTDVVKAINSASKKIFEESIKPNSSRRKRSGRNNDSVFRFNGAVPAERRNSARLQNKKPDYTYLDLPDDKQVNINEDSLDHLEDVVFKVKKPRKSTREATPAKILPAEEVTESMIKNIHLKGNKIYDSINGTSCHQCRQKTRDQKTVCRSGFCVGVRGQFCGVCVTIRYGEDPAKALKDPNWKCYACRGCCNCSFCRLKEGKRPTGILAPLAMKNGFKSVYDYLISLKGYGDYSERDPNNLLGFDGTSAVVGGGTRIDLSCKYDYDHTCPANLLGFDGDVAILLSKRKVNLK